MEDLYSSGWDSAVEQQLAERLNEVLWSRLQRRRSKSELCQQFADLADGIEKCIEEIASRLTKTMMKELGAEQFAQDLASQLILTSIKLPFGQQLGLLAKRVRVVGVYLCVTTGQLDTCPCLRALLTAQTEAGLEVVLQGALSEPPQT